MSELTRAVSLLQSGDAAAARQLLLGSPGETAHHAFLLGACAHAMGDVPAAVHEFTSALRRDPGHAQAACALGSLYAGLGHRREAEALFRRALDHTDDAQLRFNLGVVLEDSGRIAEALDAYAALLKRFPDHYAARHNRAGLLAREKRLAEAAAEYRLLTQYHPEQTLPRHNLGELELALGHYEEAARLLAGVMQREPGNGKALLSLAVAQAANGDIAASTESFSRLRAEHPARWEEARARVNDTRGNDSDIDPRLIFLVREHEHLQACHWLHWSKYGPVFRDFIRNPGDGEATGLAYQSMAAPLTAAEQRRLMQHIAGQVARRCTPFTHARSPAPQRLRIGYCATRFGHHVTGQLLRNFFAAHDTAAVEVYAISLGADDGSANIATIRATPGLRWIDLAAESDVAAAAQIRALELDVLVDLAVYSDAPRPEVLAHRPAPVQAGWLGAAYTSGAPWLDYVFSDAVASPGDNWCSEAEIIMPACYFMCSHVAEAPATPSREALGLPEGRFVFTCLNTPFKLQPDIFARWMRLLAAAPESVLWLLSSSSAQIVNLKREAEWRGIDPRRLLFAPRVAPHLHVARQGAADLFLDTPFFNGHTTVAESLWAGTPALTCPGETFASRVGASLVTSCGLPELVVASWEAYEATALRLYRDRDELAALRRRLAANRTTAAPYDLHAQARAMEKAFRHMRQRFAQGLPPEKFRIADLAD
jgi:predicted O-linked N-acetylglucosamine transferase (SPINDLY family)